jgi:hypothetical protein
MGRFGLRPLPFDPAALGAAGTAAGVPGAGGPGAGLRRFLPNTAAYQTPTVDQQTLDSSGTYTGPFGASGDGTGGTLGNSGIEPPGAGFASLLNRQSLPSAGAFPFPRRGPGLGAGFPGPPLPPIP